MTITCTSTKLGSNASMVSVMGRQGKGEEGGEGVGDGDCDESGLRLMAEVRVVIVGEERVCARKSNTRSHVQECS